MSDNVKKNEADKIWEEIRQAQLDVFALTGQTVEMHVTKLDVPGSDLFIKLKSTSVLPALEICLGKRYEVEQASTYTIIRRAEDREEKVMKAIENSKKLTK